MGERDREKEIERERKIKREKEREREREGGGRESISKHHSDLTLFFTYFCTVTSDVYSMYDAA